MEFRQLKIAGLLEIVPKAIQDERGYFSEIFRHDAFSAHAGQVDFVQDNQSLSVRAGTIRGIHFQSHPYAQGKLVRCLAGSVLDVAVDLRIGSPTFGQWAGITLSPSHNNQLWIPPGFGHAFCTLMPDTIIAYRVTNYYSPEHDKGLAWNDPDIAIAWPDLADPDLLSNKDRQQPSLAELPPYFTGEA